MISAAGRPLVTALIDTYNQGRFIEEAVESVLAQGLLRDEMEILVVDDGSTDDTPHRIRKYGDRIRYIRKSNGGQASALNVGFAEARGDFVALLDADDLWLPGKLCRVVDEFAKHPEAVLVCHPNSYWNAQQDRCEDEQNFFSVCGEVLRRREDVLRYGNFSTSGITIRREQMSRLFPIPAALRMFADTYLIILSAALGPVLGIPNHLTQYRIHGQNLYSSQTRDPLLLRQRWDCYKIATEEAKRRLAELGYDLDDPALSLWLKRHELTERMFRFQYQGARRRELYRHLKAQIEVFHPLWSRRYRFYQHVLAFAALLLGYERFTGLQAKYRGAVLASRFREYVFPSAAMERRAH